MPFKIWNEELNIGYVYARAEESEKEGLIRIGGCSEEKEEGRIEARLCLFILLWNGGD